MEVGIDNVQHEGEDWRSYWDDVTCELLDTGLAREARAEETREVHRMGMPHGDGEGPRRNQVGRCEQRGCQEPEGEMAIRSPGGGSLKTAGVLLRRRRGLSTSGTSRLVWLHPSAG